MKTAKLQFSDITIEGTSDSFDCVVYGELVFQTGMVGYLEALTDPSYRGQILVLTYPLTGNYGVLDFSKDSYGLLNNYESNDVQVAALVISECCENPSHYKKVMGLREWLKENKVPLITNVDTRQLVKIVREKGTIQTKLSIGNLDEIIKYNPDNFVKEVSIKNPKLYKSNNSSTIEKITIAMMDFGMKFSQLKMLLKRGFDIMLLPYDFDIKTIENIDGLFLSNGPGDPQSLEDVIKNLKYIMEYKKIPVFGICLGHQLLALAANAKSYKMKYGNRGHNIPCIQKFTNQCYITSQNHGYAIDTESLNDEWLELFINANDNSNEGIIHKTMPWFSVQFHPEARAGPTDCEFLFDVFSNSVKKYHQTKKLEPLYELLTPQNIIKAPKITIKKVLILGSGGLSIGQAGEFDYSGSQAIKALKEENIYTILVNPNIATTQTSKGLADKVYFVPVNYEFVKKVIINEKPDGIYVTFGGQTALNVGIALKDEFESLGVKVLGTDIQAIINTEDRNIFAKEMEKINEPCAPSYASNNIQQAMEDAQKIGYPVIVRAAYALGGLGSGFAENSNELKELCTKAFAYSSQVLIEKSLKGWKEIEYEIVRDRFDNCITVCNMENFDPLGIHTGDSIVVAPSQTLSDEEYNMLRKSSIKIAKHLKIIGECNAQFALDPKSKTYYIIEVNARLSRSSALASKATGYPLAFVAAKLGLGKELHSIKNKVTLKTCACFEPSLDYIVVKIPKWDLNKFSRVSTKINSSMKSVGEVMAIGRKFEEALMKAIRAMNPSFFGFEQIESDDIDIDEELKNPSDMRLFVIANALQKNYSIEKIANLTNIDKWFLHKLEHIHKFEKELTKYDFTNIPLSKILKAKQLGFSDPKLGKILKTSEMIVRKHRKDNNIIPYFKQIDTVSAEFPAFTNYLYLTYNANEHDVQFEENGVIVLGSGVYRIGSSVEFDWCAVNAVRTLRKNKIKSIMINYNPETVSTDYDEADRLCFENISTERVLDVYEQEKSKGIIISMGGQTSNNIAMQLHRYGAKILGTAPEMIDTAENRFKFSRLLDKMKIDQPKWKELNNLSQALEFCELVKYPVLVRPSYVLSGAAMNVAYSKDELEGFLKMATKVSNDHPVVISKFIENAKEIELDGVCKNGEIYVYVITEHVENAGVHSGDATLIHPPQDLDIETIRKVKNIARKICCSLNVSGPFNMQFIAKNNLVKVIECNLRAARSFPFVSKTTNIDIIELATKIIMELPTEKIKYVPNKSKIAVKASQFSFSRLSGADPILGVEMASTGEVACFGKNVNEAYIKAIMATGFVIPKKFILVSIGSYKDKTEFLPFVKKLVDMGFSILATLGTADFIGENGIKVTYVDANDKKITKEEYSLINHIKRNNVNLYINIPSKNKDKRPMNYSSLGYKTRRLAIDFDIPLITNIKCAKMFVNSLEYLYKKSSNSTTPHNIDLKLDSVDYQSNNKSVVIQGLIAFITDLRTTHLKIETYTIIEKLENFLKRSYTHLFLTTLINEIENKEYFDEIKKIKEIKHVALTKSIKSINCIKTTLDIDTYFLVDEENIAEFIKNIKEIKILTSNNKIFIYIKDTNKLARIILIASLNKIEIHVLNMEYNEENIELIKNIKNTNDIKLTIDTDYKKDLGEINKLVDFFNFTDIENIIQNESTKQTNMKKEIVEDPLYSIISKLTNKKTRVFDHKTFNNIMFENIVTMFNMKTNKNQVVEIEIISAQQIDDSSENMVYKCDRVGIVTKRELRESDKLQSQTLFLQTQETEIENVVETEQSQPQSIIQTISSKEIVDKAFYNKHVLHTNQFTKDDLHRLFDLAREMEILTHKKSNHSKLNFLNGYIMALIFYEPSTRTSTSFETAMYKLGGKTVKINPTSSSIKKGETLQDTIKTVAQYSDLIVLRHPIKNSVQEAAQIIQDPTIINAGDGDGEHPTQAFLDVYTIREELGTVNGLIITLIGDLKHSRTIHSLVKLLCLYNVQINYVSSPDLKIPKELMEHVASQNIKQQEFTNIEDVIHKTDVLYVTRIQKERFENTTEIPQIEKNYTSIVNENLLTKAKNKMIIMHPLPRNLEIDTLVDLDQRACYFRQMKYGLYIRMALILMVLGKNKEFES